MSGWTAFPHPRYAFDAATLHLHWPALHVADAEPLPAPFPLSLDEQRAILGFAERGSQLSAARRAELAALLAEPLQVPAEQAEPRLNGIARGLLGSAP